MKKENRLILEFTEFNLQRFNSDSVQAAIHVDNPQLSTNAFDKHQDKIRSGLSRVNDILRSIKMSDTYHDLRAELSLEKQDIKELKILKVLKVNNVKYDVYVSFTISGVEYWGTVVDICGFKPIVKSEVFKDQRLIQSPEWIIKTKGILINTIKKWMHIESGKYKLLNNEIYVTSSITGSRFKVKEGDVITVLNSSNDTIFVEFNGDRFELKYDNFIYFNWWFEKI